MVQEATKPAQAAEQTSFGLTRKLTELARGYRYEALPPDVIQMVKNCFLDWLGVTLAGTQEPGPRMTRDYVLEQGGKPQATLLGTARKTSTQNAALANGTASHVLDFDDLGLIGHPSVTIFGALLALAESKGIDGREFITAFVAGIETEGRIGTLVAPSHYAAGWHSTATVGTFGAAASSAYVLGLDLEQWLNALGIAGTQAAGLKSMFGTMCKSFQAGKADVNGLLAAELASRGFTSNQDILETPQGFAYTQTTTPNPQGALEGLGSDFQINKIYFKPYACCGGTHATIKGVTRLRERYNLTPDNVESITLRIAPMTDKVCNIYAPGTPLEGKFSLRFTAALALSGINPTDQAFTEENIHSPAITAIRDRVTVILDPAFNDSGAATEVTIKLKDGSELREMVPSPGPGGDKDEEWKILVEKFKGVATPVIGQEHVTALIEAIGHLEDITNLSEITGLCVPN